MTAGALGFLATENMATIIKKELIDTELFERWLKTDTGRICCPESFRREL